MRQYTANEKNMLSKVNEIVMEVIDLPGENFIFAILSPYLDELMNLLKQLNDDEMYLLFMQYEGVMKLMRIIEDGAQQVEKEFGLT